MKKRDKNMHKFTLFKKLVKIKVFDRFWAITASCFRDLIKIKEFGTLTWTISNNFFFIVSTFDEFHFFRFSTYAEYFFCK